MKDIFDLFYELVYKNTRLSDWSLLYSSFWKEARRFSILKCGVLMNFLKIVAGREGFYCKLFEKSSYKIINEFVQLFHIKNKFSPFCFSRKKYVEINWFGHGLHRDIAPLLSISVMAFWRLILDSFGIRRWQTFLKTVFCNLLKYPNFLIVGKFLPIRQILFEPRRPAY